MQKFSIYTQSGDLLRSWQFDSAHEAICAAMMAGLTAGQTPVIAPFPRPEDWQTYRRQQLENA